MQLYRATLLHTRATKLREQIAGVISVLQYAICQPVTAQVRTKVKTLIFHRMTWDPTKCRLPSLWNRLVKRALWKRFYSGRRRVQRITDILFNGLYMFTYLLTYLLTDHTDHHWPHSLAWRKCSMRWKNSVNNGYDKDYDYNNNNYYHHHHHCHHHVERALCEVKAYVLTKWWHVCTLHCRSSVCLHANTRSLK